MQRTIETTDAPELVIEVDGDLKIEGDGDMAVVLETEDKNTSIDTDGNRITVRCHSDCDLTVPHYAAIKVKAVGGDARIEEVTGPISVGPVGGDLDVSEAGVVEAHSVGGDCRFDECDGPVTVRSVGGDLSASGCAFGGRSLSVGGDVSIELTDLADESYTLNAGGDVSLAFPEGANARIDINDSEGSRRVTLGTGAVQIRVNAGGDTSIRHAGEGDGGEDEDLGEVVSASVDDAMRNVEREINNMQRNLENMTRDFAERFSTIGVPAWKIERAQSKAEAASRKVEAKMRQRMTKLEERARREQERAARKAERAAARSSATRRGYTWPGAPPKSPVPPVPPEAPNFSNTPFETPAAPRRVTDDERLLILRMLQEKKISTEQAEQLLSALER